MELQDTRVLVVGGAGFIGSHLVELLLDQDVRQVTVFDNFTRGTRQNIEGALRDDRVEVFEAGGDITQTDILNEAVADADAVFHLAALWLLQCHDYPRSAFDVNIGGTFNVLEACVRHDIKKLVYSSSASVYGDALEIPMTEEHPYNNRTFYGATKVAGEQMARAFNERYGLDYVGLRYMNVYGPRQDYKGAYISVIMKILDRIDQGLPPIVYGNGLQSYDFIHVRDVARANVCAMVSDASDHFYNVGRGISTTIRELCEQLLELKDASDLGIEYRPEEQSFVTQRVGCPLAAQSEIGFGAQIGLEEGLRSLIEWRERDRVGKEITL